MMVLGQRLKMTEAQWQKRVLGMAALFKWRAWHDRATNAPRTCPTCKAPIKLPRNDPGWPDLFMVRGETLIVAELKSDRGQVTDEQLDWLSALQQVKRVMVVVWRPRSEAVVEEVLRDH